MDNKKWKKILKESKELTGYKPLRESLLEEEFTVLLDSLPNIIDDQNYNKLSYTDGSIVTTLNFKKVKIDRGTVSFYTSAGIFGVEKREVEKVTGIHGKQVNIVLSNGNRIQIY